MISRLSQMWLPLVMTLMPISKSSSAIGGVMPSLYAIIRRITPEQDIGKAFGLTAFIGSAAWCIGPLAGGYISLLTGKPGKPYYVAPFILCGVSLILIAWLAAWRVKPPIRYNEIPAAEELTPPQP